MRFAEVGSVPEMDTPPIRYVHTGDGVSIAYTVFGQGPPLCYAFAGPGLSFFEFEWKLPSLVEQYEVMAQERTIIRFDWRNTGLSSRGVEDVGCAAHISDLLALQDHLGFERMALRVHGSAGVAIRFAATHPERVSALVLSSPSVAVADRPPNPGTKPSVTQQILGIAAGADWRLFTRLLSASLFGWYGEEAAWLAECAEKGTTAADFFAAVAATGAEPISGFTENVRCPTLIMQRRDPPNYFYDRVDPDSHLADSRMLSRDLPNARLVILEGSSMMMTTDPASTTGLLMFLREVDPAEATSTDTQGPATVRTIVFTDIEGHTEMMQRLGDEKGREVLREHERITRSALAAHGGGEVKTMGDGFLASFASPQRALDCAIALQRAFAAEPGEPLSVRIGINAGEPIAEESDLFGSSVIAAARIAAQATGRQVLVSDVVRQLVAGKGFRFTDSGERVLKGMHEPVRVWELDWAGVEIGPKNVVTG